ncbi:ABC transporter permease [Paenibacillus lautus]|jgi:peptide/nickel transport system permease protein|uniref:ABC transporter permease n=1 Tax=Paenibacillus lautus TaxID=1401 RepID=A0A385TV01_PAELA|nr:ABC transporter permease [Paenibacillus lautus]AYB46868.1 ABC transporter permease [Paenibacillus lautus]MBY0164581.1 ABC transporter permease [Cytobacillus firmus]MCI1773871.1 ABC transporter permease [Paenibacillus lautus]VTR20387.1 ABC transporter ATP-binding protein/permease [Actinobacillus pleuropneumoniae]
MATVQEKEYVAQVSKKLKKEQRALGYRRLKSNYGLLIGASIFVVLVILALIGPLFTNYGPYDMKVVDRLTPPGAEHWLGTDEFGRDLLTRLLYGARVSISVGLAVALLSSALGLVIGVYATYYKTLDHILMRICDGLIAIPGILLAIALMAALGASALNVIIALTIVFTPNIARVVRSAALVVREQTYIEAMHVQGASSTRIIWQHIVPNTLSPLLVQATFVFAEAIISEAALSFLGAGIPAPEASWGNILQASKLVIYKAWWMVVFPGATLVLSVLSLNLLGDGLRDLLDPRVKQKFRKR